MSVHQVTSKQLMEVLGSAQSRLESLVNNNDTLVRNLNKRLTVIRNIQEYEQQQMEQLLLLLDSNQQIQQYQKIVFVRSNIVQGIYDKFGSTIYPQLLKEPTQVFNFKTAAGYVFKNNATVTITTNDTSRTLSEYASILAEDTVTGKDIFFEEYDTNTIQISVRVNPGELLGSTAFNLLEIVPYIPGSFDITSLEIFSMQGYYTGDTQPASSFPNRIKKVGISRFLIDQTINLYELRMTVSLNFRNNNGKYPFGIKHLYFLNASFNSNSYVTVQVDTNRNLDMISEDVTVVDQSGIVNSTCKEERIGLFSSWNNGLGTDEIATSKGLTYNPVTRNIKTFFVHYPILRSVTSLQFNEVVLR